MNSVRPWWYHGSLLQFAVAASLLQIAPANPGPQQSPPAASPSADTQTGSQVHTVGGGVSAPVPIYRPAPRYSDEARRARFQGTATLSIVVDPSGNVRDARILRPLRPDLDANALECVRTWKFEPGLHNGVPVPVRVLVEMSFRLHTRCQVPIAFAESAGEDPKQLSWGQFPEEALKLWSQKGGSREFPLICSTDRSSAKYAVVSRKSSHPEAMRSEVYQLAAGKIQFPALFISKDTTSPKHAFKDALKYIDRAASKSP